LVEKLRDIELIFRDNVVLAVISSPFNQTKLVEYLKSQTKINVCVIENDEKIELFT